MKLNILIITLILLFNGCSFKNQVNNIEKENSVLNDYRLKEEAKNIQEMRNICLKKGYTWHFSYDDEIECGAPLGKRIEIGTFVPSSSISTTVEKESDTFTSSDLIDTIIDALIFNSIY